jgi:hypothetical protein
MLFLGVVGTVLMVVASVSLPGAERVVRLAGECVCGYFVSEFKMGRGRDLLWVRLEGSYLNKKPVSCTYRSVMKD